MRRLAKALDSRQAQGFLCMSKKRRLLLDSTTSL